MITTHSSDGLTFLHDDDPEGGKLHIVVDPTKIKVDIDNINGSQFVSLTLEYNDVRDLVLDKLRLREMAKIENMNGDELAAYFTGDWVKLDELQGRR